MPKDYYAGMGASIGRDDPDAYDRIQWQRHDTLDPEARRRRIPAHLLRALCTHVNAPKLRRAA
jgi:hypothetical protein